MISNGKEANERMQQQQNAMMTMMIQMSDKSTNNLIEMMKANQGVGSGSGVMKEITDMVMSAVDLKEALGGARETPFDKIITMVGAVLPQLMAVAAMNKQAQMNDPRVMLAKTYVAHNPEIQSVLKDPAKTSEMIRSLDDVYGYEQTDAILGVMGLPRPDDCPRNPSQQLPQSERSSFAEAATEDSQQT
jgi:hypothetical protein